MLHDLGAAVQHLEGPVVLARRHEGLGAGHEEVPYRKHPEMGVLVLVVDEIVIGGEGVPAVDLGHLAVQLVGVDESGLRRGGLVLYGHELERIPFVFKVLLDAYVYVAAHAEQVDRPVPLIARQEVEHEELGFGDEILVLGNVEHDGVRNLVGELRVHYAVLYHVLLVDGY